MSDRRIAGSVAALLALAAAAGAETAGELPRIVAPLDGGKVEAAAGTVAVASAVEEGRGAPSKAATRLDVPALSEGAVARAWLTPASAPVALAGVDGISFWIRGTGKPGHASIVLAPAEPEGAALFVSRVHLVNPLWHRVFLPLSEFHDPSSHPTDLRRFDAGAIRSVRIGLQVAGPTSEARSFALDEIGVSTWAEVNRTLGWSSYMPPSHGLPPYLDRFDGDLAWRAEGGAKAGLIPLEDFPHEGFRRGLLVELPSADALVSRELDLEPLPYFEGFAFWIKGDGREHAVDVTLSHGGEEEPFVFTCLVRGAGWKLVFAGFENFKRGREAFEVEDAPQAFLGFRLREPGPARLLLGPMRFGYEK